MKGMTLNSRDLDRFWRRVQITPKCWIWMAGKNTYGYGRMSVKDRMVGVHRISYELAYGPIPADKMVDHTCHNRACVNPDHLRLATNKQNVENRARNHRNNQSGAHGVCWHKTNKKWQALVMNDGKRLHLGYFATVDEAQDAVVRKRNELFTRNDIDRKLANQGARSI